MYTTHACSRNREVKCERQVKINAVFLVASNDNEIMLHVLRTFGERNGSAQGHK